MENKELAEQLRVAAEILETGKEWEWSSHVTVSWIKPNQSLLYHVSSGHKIRIKPWSLPAPPEGEQWHRAYEWKEGMLDKGERPLLDGEVICDGDIFIDNLLGAKEWHGEGLVTASNNVFPFKTSRQLPQKKTKKIVPLGPEDVPPLSVFKNSTAESGISLGRNFIHGLPASCKGFYSTVSDMGRFKESLPHQTSNGLGLRSSA